MDRTVARGSGLRAGSPGSAHRLTEPENGAAATSDPIGFRGSLAGPNPGCRERDSNPHAPGRGQKILSLQRLPFRHPGVSDSDRVRGRRRFPGNAGRRVRRSGVACFRTRRRHSRATPRRRVRARSGRRTAGRRGGPTFRAPGGFPGAPAFQTRNRVSLREWGGRFGNGEVAPLKLRIGKNETRLRTEPRGNGRSDLGRRSFPQVSGRRLSQGRRFAEPLIEPLITPGIERGTGRRRRRADSNRRIEVLQTSALATWLRRQPRGLDPLRRLRGTNASAGWSGTRDSNPRLQPWQGCTLPLS